MAGVSACDGTDVATVTNIVDGDTIDVEQDGAELRVRLLNIDTPESTDPNVEPECLGPEATEFVESLIPVGTEVTLETDEELHDQYDRLLAGVYVDDTFVNAEIARAGLGVAMLYEPNDRFYDEVLTAQDEAREAQRGLYDPDVECTVPAQVADFANDADDVVSGAIADDAALEQLEGYGEEVAVAIASAVALEALLTGDQQRFPLRVFTGPELASLRQSVDVSKARLDEADGEVTRAILARKARLAEELRAAEEEARRAEEEAQRIAEEEEAERREAEEEAQRAAEQAEREATQRRRQEQRPSQQPGQSQQSGSSSSGSGSSSSGSGSGSSGSSGGSSGGYDGYTGCRAYGGNYAPNAVDEQGRAYTKIDCTTKVPIG